MEKPKLFVIFKREFDHNKYEWLNWKAIHVFENRKSAIADFRRLCDSAPKTFGISLDVEYSLFVYSVDGVSPL